MENVRLADGVEKCVACGKEIPEGRQVCVICGYKADKVKQTNYDRIGSMSVDELAGYIYSHDDELNDKICKQAYDKCPYGDNVEPENCKGCIKKWLESEVTE